MIFFGTNDPYWTIDAAKHYINDIPGNNLLHYVPNAGHGLGKQQQAFNSLSAFLALNLANESLPVYSWSLTEKKNKINLDIKITSENIVRAVLWTSNSDSRDFRKAVWKSTDIDQNKKDKSIVKVRLKYPEQGFSAFYVDLIYLNTQGKEYSISTRAYVADKSKVL